MAISNRTSFFDDDDETIKFEWEKLSNTPHKNILGLHPILSADLSRSQANNQTFSPGYFLLYQRCIVQFKNNATKQPEGVLDISSARFQITTNGFSLTKNGNTYEFSSSDEGVLKTWIEHLKAISVLVTFHEDYKAIKMIGKGSFAKVYLVESKATGKSYAVKAFTKESVILSNKNNAKSSIINEIDIMRCLSHENIIQLYEVYESDRSLYLVLELIQGKSVQDTLKKSSFKETYSEVKIINMIRSILDALAYLGTKGIMHRDLKPDNILLDKNDKIKVVDFGLATFIKLDTYIFKKCGTPGYIAPEVFKYDEKTPSTSYDDRCDVFSAGCILFYMLFGTPFFNGSNASEILRMNRKFTTEFDSIDQVKQELKNPKSNISKDGLLLLLELLEFDPKKRKFAADALKSPFFTPTPSDTKKGLGITDSGSDKYSDSPNSANSQNLQQFPSMKQSANNYQKDKYEQKDSLYIDVGQPLLNGKTDTLTAGVGSHNNSLLLGQGPIVQGSNANSLSKFAKGGKSGGSDLRKIAIMKNTMRGDESDGESPKNSPLHRGTQSPGMTSFSKMGAKTEDTQETDEGTQLQKNYEKIAQDSSDKHPSKTGSPAGKRYTLLENKSAGNSPKVQSQTQAAGGFSQFHEETKSPK